MENNRIKPVDVANELSTSFLDYSMSVIISRALPDVRDGLKPSQRRILYAMKELNLSPGGKTRKCSKIVGDTMGNYHPHGDAAIYGTLVNMAQDWSMRDILVIGQGNFGTPDGDPPAAARYTEAKLSGMGVALMADLDKDTVDFVPTYDNEHTEPTVFPSAFPNLLVNGGTGIAVGMATNMPPHNLGEVVDGICAVIDSPHMTVDELRQFIKGPDFPTGGDILGFSGSDNYFRTGRGSVRIRGKIDIEQVKKMGPLKGILSKIPGVGKQLEGVDIDDRQIDWVQAIILSMTPEERSHPHIMNPSRKRRIAAGSGRSIEEVNRLIKQIDQMQKMMRQMTKGGKGSKKRRKMKGLPGLGGMPMNGMGPAGGMGGPDGMPPFK